MWLSNKISLITALCCGDRVKRKNHLLNLIMNWLQEELECSVMKCFNNMVQNQGPIKSIKKIYSDHEFIREHCKEKALALLHSEKVSFVMIHSLKRVFWLKHGFKTERRWLRLFLNKTSNMVNKQLKHCTGVPS